MDDLVTWLRAQLNEDERVAQVAPGGQWGITRARDDLVAHIARHDPARVLAEVQAKRRVLDLYEVTSGGRELHVDAWAVMKLVIQHLALPLADQPGFRDEWRAA